MSNIPNNTISIDKKGNLIYTAKIYDFIDNEFFTCIVCNGTVETIVIQGIFAKLFQRQKGQSKENR